MKGSSVVKVDFKRVNNKKQQEQKDGKCCEHLEKCAGHSLNG